MPASGSPPAVDPSPLSEVDRRALTRFLEQSLDQGFRLAIIEAATHAEREAILSEVEPVIGSGLLRVALDELDLATTNIWGALCAAFTAHEPRCMALWGIESRSISDWPRQLNVQRELFVRDLAVPWLLFIHPAMRVPLLQTAPDFCDFAVLWLRGDRQVEEVGLPAVGQTRDLPSARSYSVIHDPALKQAQASLNSGQFDDARDFLSRFDVQPRQDAVDQIHRQLLGARLERELGHLYDAESILRDARRALAHQAVAEANILAPTLDIELGHVLLLTGRYGEAETLLRASLAQVERSPEPRALVRADLLHELAGALTIRGNCREAERLLRDSLALKESALGHGHISSLASLQALASALAQQGEYPAAERIFREALALEKKTVGRRHLAYSASLHALAFVCLEQGNYAEAERLVRESLVIAEDLVGREHLSYGDLLHTLASVLFMQGDYLEAERLLRDALTIKEKSLGRQHPSCGASLHQLANALAQQGRYRESEQLLREALAIDTRALGAEHPSVGASLHALARLLAEQGDYTEAERLFRESLTVKETALGPEHPSLCPTLASLAVLAANQGRVHEAARLFERASHIGHAALGPEHPEVRTIERLAAALEARAKI